MPDEHDNQDDDNPVIRELRTKAKRADALEPEVATLRQENAILKAGITDLTPAKQKALLAAHEGELEPEALRQTAVELGFAAKPEEPAEQASAEEQAAHQRMQEATTGSAAEAQGKTLSDEINAAKSEDEVMAIVHREGLQGQE